MRCDQLEYMYIQCLINKIPLLTVVMTDIAVMYLRIEFCFILKLVFVIFNYNLISFLVFFFIFVLFLFV